MAVDKWSFCLLFPPLPYHSFFSPRSSAIARPASAAQGFDPFPVLKKPPPFFLSPRRGRFFFQRETHIFSETRFPYLRASPPTDANDSFFFKSSPPPPLFCHGRTFFGECCSLFSAPLSVPVFSCQASPFSPLSSIRTPLIVNSFRAEI